MNQNHPITASGRRLADGRAILAVGVLQGCGCPATEADSAAQCEVETIQVRPRRIGGARLFNRVFDIDMQRCPNCGAGEMKIIAAILERPVIEKILTHLGLDPQPRPRAARARRGKTDAA